MLKKVFCLLILPLFFSPLLFAQPFSAFVNVKGELYAFDGTTTQELDYLQPISYKVGGNLVAFIDNTKSFKVFHNGRVTKINDGYTTDYAVSRDLLLIHNQSTLYCYDDGLQTMLARISSKNVLGDSLIGFYDDQTLTYRLYADGKIIKLEENDVEYPLKMQAMGSNVFAWVNTNDDFKIYYQGDIIEQESEAPTRIWAGRDIVVYNDHYGTFRVFYKGETTDVESFPPKTVRVGDNVMAYQNNLNELKIFYDGKMYETNSISPKYLKVSHNLVVFDNGSGGLSVFYKGDITQLENYIPTGIVLGDNTLYYFDEGNQIKIFSFGNQETLPNGEYDSVELDWDVIQLKTGFNQYKFYYKGKIY